MNAAEYFAKEAEIYDNRLNSGILGIIRNAEKKAVLNSLQPQKGEDILDVPCGTGYYADFIKKSGAEVYGIDISSEMLDVFKKKGYKGEVGSLETFSIKKKFDKILSAGGFEFCKEHKQIVRNLLSHVKDNGSVILLVTRKNVFGWMFWGYHYLLNKTSIALFSKKEIAAVCSHEDADIIEIRPCSL